MTPAVTLWLSFVLAAGVLAWATPRLALPFALVALLTLPGAFMTLGRAAPWRPPAGEYAVLGARIDVDVAIYVMVDGKPAPRMYRLPYSTKAANDLQAALDGAADGQGGVAMIVPPGDDSPGFAEDSGPGDPPKRTETPAINLGA